MASDLKALAEAAGTTSILALFVDLDGKPCAKLVPVEAIDQLVENGAGFAGYAVGAIGQEAKDPDLIAVPDPSSFTPIPFVKEGLAIVHCDPHVDGKPWPFAPRVILRAVLAKAAEAGFSAYAGAEKLGSAAGFYDQFRAGQDPAGTTTQDPELQKRLDPETGGRRIANFLRVLTIEAPTIARACGKAHVTHLEPEDMVAISIEAAGGGLPARAVRRGQAALNSVHPYVGTGEMR